MTDHEAIVIAASVLVDPLVGVGRTLALVEEAEQVVDSYLPERVSIVLDFTNASDSGDISFWWHQCAMRPGYRLIVDRARQRIPRVRNAWLLDHGDNSSKSLLEDPDRVRRLIFEPGDARGWTRLCDEIREYAAVIAIDRQGEF